jgi:hypothetical protein
MRGAAMSTLFTDTKRKRDSHVWEREANDWYVEPAWVSERLFATEGFYGHVNDPAVGSGNIVQAARRAWSRRVRM